MSLPNGEFLVSGAQLNGKPVVLLVDPSNPNNLVAGATAVPSTVNGMTVSGNTLYATTDQGLSVYNVGPMAETPVTVSVEVPNNTGVSIVANSFNVPPSQTITGTDYDTLVWTETMASLDTSFTFTWNTTVSNLASGESQDVTLGANVAFTDQGTSGSLSLPATSVTAVPIIQLVPTSQTVPSTGTVTYNMRLTNPTNSSVTYGLYFSSSTYYGGYEFGNDVYDVTVGPEGTVNEPLTLIPGSETSPGDYSFTVTAASDYSVATGSATGTLIVEPAPVTEAYGIVVQLTPSQAAVGQGTSTQYVIQLTNTGSATGAFDLQITGLPNDVYYSFSEIGVDLPPGASNFEDVTLTLTADNGGTPGTIPFQVTATSETERTVSGSAWGPSRSSPTASACSCRSLRSIPGIRLI